MPAIKYMNNLKTKLITHNKVKELLNYDPLSGYLTWRCVRGSTIRPGDKAQEHQMSLMGVRMPTSHVIWFWMTGNWPTETIDYINRNSSDNRWHNLRDVSQTVKSVNHTMKDDKECISELSSGQYAVNIDCGSQMLVVGVYGNYSVAVKVYDACLYLRESLQAQLDNK